MQISKDSRIRIASLGSGAAEAERQFVTTLLSGDQVRNVTIMTIDTSELAHTLVAQTFNETHDPRVTIVRENVVSRDDLLRLEREHKTPVLIVQCQNDIFDLSREFQPRDFTVVMTMLFLHHLDNDGVIKLMEIMSVLGRYSLNYDGLRSDIHLLPQTLTGWSHPVFLNAVVFSNLRFATKQNIKRRHAGSSLRFYSHGHYLALNEQR